MWMEVNLINLKHVISYKFWLMSWVLITWLSLSMTSAYAATASEVNSSEDHLFLLKSTSFHDKGILDDRYTCDGKDLSPGLKWEGVPAGTKSLVLTVVDVDAPNGIFYHWILYDIPPTTTALPEGIQKLPPPTQVGQNSWNKLSYNGPCPPKGSTHYYIITLYALNNMLNTPALTGPQLSDLLQDNVIDKVELNVLYGRR